MKRILTILVMVMSVVIFTSCGDISALKKSTDLTEQNELCKKIVLKKAKRNHFNMNNYYELKFDVFQLFSVDKELTQYEDRWIAIQKKYKETKDDLYSIFYDFESSDHCCVSGLLFDIDYANNRYKTEEDYALIKDLYFLMKDVYNTMYYGEKELVGYRGTWTYLGSVKGVYEKMPAHYKFYFDIYFSGKVYIDEVDGDMFDKSDDEIAKNIKLYGNTISELISGVGDIVNDKQDKWESFNKIGELLYKHQKISKDEYFIVNEYGKCTQYEGD